jgi:predicted 3-demethylubiquinone-9 3-methyltransferase (glyoxalase superfamily)
VPRTRASFGDKSPYFAADYVVGICRAAAIAQLNFMRTNCWMARFCRDQAEFTLMGQPFMAFSAGPLDAFNHSISFMVQCDDQTEIDRLWAALSDGGKVERCGWLKDRYGLYWQIAPSILGDMMKDPDRMRAKRVAEAMLNMVKIDIEGLQTAYEGRSA